jgi:exodeoxyribonuclease VIII
MNFQDYLKLDRLSASALKDLNRSPAYFKWKRGQPRVETDTLRLGTAIHIAILENEKFDSLYVKAPKLDKRTKLGKAEFECFVADNIGKIVLDSSDHGDCVGISKSVMASPKIAAMIKNGEIEKTYLWELDGVEMKSRIDFESQKFFLDVKSTADCDARRFSNDCITFGYDIQMACYQEAIFQNTGKRLPCIILAVEKSDNYDFQIFELNQDWLDMGIKKAKKLIGIYKECIEKDYFPTYPKVVQQLQIPNWVNFSDDEI